MNTEIVSLHKAFIIQHNMVQVLSNVDMKLNAGEFAYIIGKTGTGKSSLLKTLYADLPLNEGLGSVAGFSLNTIARIDIPLLRRNIGMVFQEYLG